MSNNQRRGNLKEIINLKSPANTAPLRKATNFDETIDISGLMRKAMQAPRLRAENSDADKPNVSQPQQQESLSFRSNPAYSPEDSLSKAASKLATMKATTGTNVLNKTNSATNMSTAAAAMAPAHQLKPQLTQASKQQASAANISQPLPSISPQTVQQQRKRPTKADPNTPGWQPENEGLPRAAADDVPLAAKTIITKRNRRKSVYQRPARYGEWFDGDDNELEQMVEEHHQGDGNTNNQGNPGHTPPASTSNSNAPGVYAQAPAAAQQQQQQATKQPITGLDADEAAAIAELARPNNKAAMKARRKSAFPAIGRTTSTASAFTRDDVVGQVKAMADDLCAKLDGLIDPESAVKPSGPDYDKSLREKLLESWEGKTYYDRLREIAGTTPNPKASRPVAGNAASQPAAASGSKPAVAVPVSKAAAPVAAFSLRVDVPTQVNQELVQRALSSVTAASTAAHSTIFTSPPAAPAVVPVVNNEPAKCSPPPPAAAVTGAIAGANAPVAVSTAVTANGGTAAAATGLLCVSARGTKPMPAPWQTDDSPDKSSVSNNNNNNNNGATNGSKKVQAKSPAVDVAAVAKENAALLEQLASVQADRDAAKEELATLKKQLEEEKAASQKLKDKLAHEIELRKEESECREAAEKQVNTLEQQVKASQGKNAAAQEQSKALKQVAETATDAGNRLELAEVQATTLMESINALLENINKSKEDVVTAAAQLNHHAASFDNENVQGGEGEGKKSTRTRRKSTWR